MESISEQSILERQVRRKRTVMADLERKPFRAPLWLRNCHVQTVGARYVRRVTLPPMRLERWDTPDGDFLRVHFCDGDPDKPVVLLFELTIRCCVFATLDGQRHAFLCEGYLLLDFWKLGKLCLYFFGKLDLCAKFLHDDMGVDS